MSADQPYAAATAASRASCASASHVPQGAGRRACGQSGDGGGDWGDGRRGTAGAGRRCGRLGGRRFLDGVPAQFGAARPAGGRLVISDAQRGSQARGGQGAGRSELAAVPRALHAESAGPGAARRPRGGRGGGPDHLRATGPRQRDGAAGEDRRRTAAALRAGGGRCWLGWPRTCWRTNKHSPEEHRTRLHSANLLERLNKEIKRRSNLVGIFPNSPALVRLVRGGSDGAGRRVGGGRPVLLQRRVDAQLTQPLPPRTAQELVTANA